MYDIFFAGSVGWDDFKIIYPNAQQVDRNISYADLSKNSFTKLFWVISDDLKTKSFDLNNYRATEWDDMYVHVFKNGNTYDGICLLPKNLDISETEFKTRHFVNKKEIDIQASVPRAFDIFKITNYEDYKYAIEHTTTDMFWMIPDDVDTVSNFDFNYYVPKYDAYHRNLSHVFLNSKFRDGIALMSKNKPVTKKEIEYRFYTNKKEIDIVASNPKQYEIFYVNTYADYLAAKEKSKFQMFWIISDDIEIDKKFKFDFYISHHNSYDRNINHIFLNGKYHDGIILCSKTAEISKKEFDYKFLNNKKETGIRASNPRPYDIVFISYNEPNADENYKALLQRFPYAKRIHGIKGIHQAHIAAAKLCDTDMFWIVDGDAQIVDQFNFDFQSPKWHKDNVYVWRSINPVNDLIYGYGGIKLFPKQKTINMDITKTDMTTSISSKFNAIPQISNITAFNTDPFNTWKSAFRECAKLSSKTIRGQIDEETEQRLQAWTTQGRDRRFGDSAIRGAIDGRDFGFRNRNNPSELARINDFDWLEQEFSKRKSL